MWKFVNFYPATLCCVVYTVIVCSSIRPSYAGIVPKQLNVRICKWEISDNISEMVQDRDIVTMED